MAGESVMTAANRNGVDVLPVDSERNAIFRCLEGQRGNQDPSNLVHVRLGWPVPHSCLRYQLAGADRRPGAQAATWSMGRRSATDGGRFFNKAWNKAMVTFYFVQLRIAIRLCRLLQ